MPERDPKPTTRERWIMHEAITTLYLYGATHRHNQRALWEIIEKIDPKAATMITDKGADAAYRRYVERSSHYV